MKCTQIIYRFQQLHAKGVLLVVVFMLNPGVDFGFTILCIYKVVLYMAISAFICLCNEIDMSRFLFC